MKKANSHLAILCAAALLGCASTKVETSGAGMREPLCRDSSVKRSALVYWQPQWRPVIKGVASLDQDMSAALAAALMPAAVSR